MKKIGLTLIFFLSTDECIKIINSFEDIKSPGIDGLGKCFYSRFWLTIEKDLVEVLNNIFLQGELTDTMKSSIITMMHKNKGIIKILNNGDLLAYVLIIKL